MDTTFWDFNQQAPSFTRRKILPGDRLITHCVYNTESRTKDTRFGEGTDDEMCFNFMLVYPRPKVALCMDVSGFFNSIPTVDSASMCFRGSKDDLDLSSLDFNKITPYIITSGTKPASFTPLGPEQCFIYDGAATRSAHTALGGAGLALWLGFIIFSSGIH